MKIGVSNNIKGFIVMLLICFDLEGPISPQDNAYEVMKLIENGDIIFETISRFDDYLTMKKKRNYEPGDTLKLIVPFLLYHEISEDDILKVSNKASIVKGAKEVISNLKRKNNIVAIISTSYEQHATNIARKLDVDIVYSTRLNLKDLRKKFTDRDKKYVKELEERIVNGDYDYDMLENYFFRKIRVGKYGVKVVGGSRKTRAVKELAEKYKIDYARVVVIGDSITDYKMLKFIKNKGLSIAFNANEYALPHAKIGVSSDNLYDVAKIIDIYDKKGIEGVIDFVSSQPFEKYQIIDMNSLEDILKIHYKYRKLLRGEAAKLG